MRPSEEGRAAVLRHLGEGASIIDRGADFGEQRFFVAVPGWNEPTDIGRIPWWHFGTGPTWEGALASYNRSLVDLGLAPVAAALARFSYTAHDEHRLYALLERVLGEAGLAFEREHCLDDKSRLDFWFPELRVAMEVKVRGAPHRVFSQVERYAEHPKVGAVLVATTLAKLARWPELVASKPVRAVRLAGAFG